MGGKTEVFYCNVKILLHHQPNSIYDERIRETYEWVSAGGNVFIFHNDLVLMTPKEAINCMIQNK